jgi:hypothetical protein
MYSSEVITPQHLTRKAVIYIRQSTPHQALSHQESLRLQYALTEHAQALGWAPEAIEVVDTDLGHSAAHAQHREGFNTLVGQVTLGQVGIILSYDVTRLSRNCSDWYPLLDLCSYKGCLIADVDGLYDPATANGRLLLGLKNLSLYNTSFTCGRSARPAAVPASHGSAECSGRYGNQRLCLWHCGSPRH